ncbi:ATP-dependent DNA helicase PIF1-like [Camellia sinensis]|uniref:ATP-dependent DNA helicase PIF1-like n=1 Tax=Camellia sinensis TaxID=4442 RepID=UPI001036D433|nr:ATP-dependent DNA helicase PIF1-like [Camellia sinensis]
MPQPTANWSATVGNRLIFEHQQLHNEAQQTDVQITIDRLNNGQQTAYNAITSSAFESKGTIFFLNGGAGTGKKFLYNTIALKCRNLVHIVVAVASSRIASLLLVGGRTAHSTFSIPLDVLENSVCGFSKQSLQVELFRKTKFIIWDEVPMQHRHCVEAIDRTLRDICDCEKPFGDLNMPLNHANLGNAIFAKFLTKVGTNPQEIIKIPSTIHRCQDIKELLSVVYPQLDVADTSTPSFLTERTILSARNDDVSAINIAALNIFPGNTYTYLAANKMAEDDEIDPSITNGYPNEFLNSLDPPGLPAFKVELKVGCPIMLLRNIALKDGLCNGTRLMVSRCDTRIIEARILTGEKFGNLAFIPRISLTPSSAEMPFRTTRRQFPVRLAYALTINKSQGQSVKFVGVDLRTPVFSHGQLYVALSRCTFFDSISIPLPNDEPDSTTNIVYPEVLL